METSKVMLNIKEEVRKIIVSEFENIIRKLSVLEQDGVFVKNMKMPEDCDHCNFFNDEYDYPTCMATNTSEGYRFKKSSRMENCPLIFIKN